MSQNVGTCPGEVNIWGFARIQSTSFRSPPSEESIQERTKQIPNKLKTEITQKNHKKGNRGSHDEK